LGKLLVGMDDDCVVVVAGWEVEIEDIDDITIVDELEEVEVPSFDVVEDSVEAETENFACTSTFAYFGGSLTVTYTLYWP